MIVARARAIHRDLGPCHPPLLPGACRGARGGVDDLSMAHRRAVRVHHLDRARLHRARAGRRLSKKSVNSSGIAPPLVAHSASATLHQVQAQIRHKPRPPTGYPRLFRFKLELASAPR